VAGDSIKCVIDNRPTDLLLAFQTKRCDQFHWAVLVDGPQFWRVKIIRRPNDAAPNRTLSEYLGFEHERLCKMLELCNSAIADLRWEELSVRRGKLLDGSSACLCKAASILVALFSRTVRRTLTSY